MRRFCLYLFVVALCGFSGCGGGDSVDMADVSGVITLKGKPLADADVYFVSGNVEGYGRTDAQGHYSLVRGAPVGDCKVYIKKTEVNKSSGGIDLTMEGMDEEQIRAMQEGQGGDPNFKKDKPLLPPEFSDPLQTKLSFNVPAGGTDKADFKL